MNKSRNKREIRAGNEFLYLDENNKNGSWTISPKIKS